MAKKSKVKKTLVDQILDKAKIDHDSLAFNGLEGELPEDVARESIYKTLALNGDKTGPVIGIVPITEHLSEKKLAKISGNKKVQRISKKRRVMYMELTILWAFVKNTIFLSTLINRHEKLVFSLFQQEKLDVLSVSIARPLLILSKLNLLILRSNYETIFRSSW